MRRTGEMRIRYVVGRVGGPSGEANSNSHKDEKPAKPQKVAPPPKSAPPAPPPENEIDPDDPMLTVPLPRYNAMLAVLRNTLYMYVPHFSAPCRVCRS